MASEPQVNIHIRTTAEPKPVQDLTHEIDKLWDVMAADEVRKLTETMGLTPAEAAAARKVLDEVKAGIEDLIKGTPESLATFAQELEAKLAPAMAQLEAKVTARKEAEARADAERAKKAAAEEMARREAEYQATRARIAKWKREEEARDVQEAAQAAEEETRRRIQALQERLAMERALKQAEAMREEQLIASRTPAYDPADDARRWREKAAGLSSYNSAAKQGQSNMAGLNAMMQQAAYLADDLQYGWRGAANNLMMVAASVPVVGGALALAIPLLGTFLEKLGETDKANLENLRKEAELTKDAIAQMGEEMTKLAEQDIEAWADKVRSGMQAYQEAMRSGAEGKGRLDAQAQAELEVELAKLEQDKQAFLASMGEGVDKKAVDAQYKKLEEQLRRQAQEATLERERQLQEDNLQRAGHGAAAARGAANAAEQQLNGQRGQEDAIRGRMNEAGIQSDQERAINRYESLQRQAQDPNLDQDKVDQALAEMDAMRSRYNMARRDVKAGKHTYDEAAKGEGLTDRQKEDFARLKSELDAVKATGEESRRILEEAKAAAVEAEKARQAAEAALKLAETKLEALRIRNETDRLTRDAPGQMDGGNSAADRFAFEDKQIRQEVADEQAQAALSGLEQLKSQTESPEVQAKIQELIQSLTDKDGATVRDLEAVKSFMDRTASGNAENARLVREIAEAAANAVSSLRSDLEAALTRIKAIETGSRY